MAFRNNGKKRIIRIGTTSTMSVIKVNRVITEWILPYRHQCECQAMCVSQLHKECLVCTKNNQIVSLFVDL